MLAAPIPMRMRPARTRQVEVSDDQEGSAFMAFLSEHREFSATHRGA
jgi:hypothetical protein